MPLFDWNTAIPNIPDSWRQTEGQNVKIAILDSGFNLNEPLFSHLSQTGHKYNVTLPGFSIPAAISSGGNDDVTDQASFGVMHGTSCLSVLAGMPEAAGTGIKGVAPKAEIFYFKVMDSGARYRKGFILDAIEIALSKNVDIIVTSILPSFNGTYTDGRRDQLFARLQSQNVALITTVLNTTNLSSLTNLSFPSDHAYSIVGGVAQIPILTPKPSASVLFDKISFLTSPVKVASFNPQAQDRYPLMNCSSSLATTALAGVVALCMSQKGSRPDRNALIAALKTAFNLPYDPNQMMTQSSPGYFSKP